VWPDLEEQVEVEAEQISHLFELYRPVIIKVSQSSPDFVEVSALASMLHSFYNGVENLFKRVAIEIDHDLPSGPYGHSELLDAMARPAATRPAVISEELRVTLKDYLNFRHIFRHTYSFNLQWAKMSHLVADGEATWLWLQAELSHFFKQS
jgi:hypothetical protein